MHRRDFLRGVTGSVALGSVGVTAVGTAAAHPGPYRPLGNVPVTNAKETVPDPSGDFAYVAATGGFATVDVQVPSDPRVVFEKRNLLADRETGPLRLVQDVKVEGDRLVVAGPANPLQGDVLQGFLLYDVSDPANPQRVAFHETEFPIHNCFVRDGIVYLTGNGVETNALVMVDVTGDDPVEVGRWSLADRDGRWTDVPSGLWAIHDVWVQDGRAYLAYWDAGTYVLDVSDPANVSFVNRIKGRSLDALLSVPSENARTESIRLPGNAHYATTNDDGTLLGINQEAWEAGGEGTPGAVELWDISDVKNPKRLSTIGPPPTSDPTIGGTWTTSHNFDIVGDRLFTSWYQGGVKIHDISDPANPKELAWWRKPDETSFWTAKRATDGFFVASSMGRRSNGKGGLYTFPIEDATDKPQKDPPSLTTEADGSAAETTSEQAALAGDTTAQSESDAATGSTPGFGVPAAVAALVGAGAWRRLRK
ncbi:LVIVD repeat-containing protein [Halorussus caseinilyticus]|uniref:LVIVD repeat-containing protein n=1 Tax=Halorussus caseinilyticus TaxID=3034025 RepID=UPI0023E7B026|nr:PGF-CTERM sorting domain-containing protein [Halorussus sp. DT72]